MKPQPQRRPWDRLPVSRIFFGTGRTQCRYRRANAVRWAFRNRTEQRALSLAASHVHGLDSAATPLPAGVQSIGARGLPIKRGSGTLPSSARCRRRLARFFADSASRACGRTASLHVRRLVGGAAAGRDGPIFLDGRVRGGIISRVRSVGRRQRKHFRLPMMRPLWEGFS
jgi:hypothetical protein